MSIRVTDPHPTVPSNRYFHTGRGGAGNRAQASSRAAAPSLPLAQVAAPAAYRTTSNTSAGSGSSTSSAFYTSGRGGAGNMHRDYERTIFSFDEELERQQRMMDQAAPVYMVGRGGAGNVVDRAHDDEAGSGYSRSPAQPVPARSARSSVSSASSGSPDLCPVATHTTTRSDSTGRVRNTWDRLSRTFSHR